MKIRALIICGLLLRGIASNSSLADEDRTVTFYSPDRNQIWNRLYAHLCVRTTRDGEVYDDLLDPPFWARTRFLITGEANRQALRLLQEFASDKKARDAMSPWHRATMQRDLIAIFCWLTVGRPGDGRISPGTQALGHALARAIRLIALPATEIQKLPNNYLAAAALKTAPERFDPKKPNVAFLPPDLLDEDGPWLLVEQKSEDSLAATVHFETFKGRSAFEVRFRHANGRAEGEKYLNELANMPHPLVLEKPSKLVSTMAFTDGPWINPDTPQFPENSVWALVRRAVLLDDAGFPVVSGIVESVQLRVYRSTGRQDEGAQSFFEWELRRRYAFGNGGMRETQPGEDSFPHFMGKGFDPFEEYHRIRVDRPPDRLSCFTCHSGIGIHSVNSRIRLFEEPRAKLPIFTVVNSTRVAEITEVRARNLPAWILLRWLGTSE